MNKDDKSDDKFVSNIQACLERLANNEPRLCEQRLNIKKHLESVKNDQGSEELKELKIQYWAIIKNMHALAKQRNALLDVLLVIWNKSNAFVGHESLDKKELVIALKNEETELLNKLCNIIDSFPLDYDELVKISDEQLRLMQIQYKVWMSISV